MQSSIANAIVTVQTLVTSCPHEGMHCCYCCCLVDTVQWHDVAMESAIVALGIPVDALRCVCGLEYSGECNGIAHVHMMSRTSQSHTETTAACRGHLRSHSVRTGEVNYKLSLVGKTCTRISTDKQCTCK